MQIPVLLITFNRPVHTRNVLKHVLESEPDNLYIFQDGERNANDSVKCTEVRNVISELCRCENLIRGKTIIHNNKTTIHFYSSIENLGCGPGPMTALNWFFSENEMGIILEDDAVPHPDFFGYCEELLNRYKDDESVRAIGSMHLDNQTYGDGSYYFSMMNRTFCAWATWARAWKDFDLYHRHVTQKQFNKVLKEYGCGLRMREYWCERLKEVQKDAYHNSSWDQQFWMSIWLNHGKGIMPNVNLSTNIGFDESGTHTTNPDSSGANRQTYPIMPLIHPSNEIINHESDQRFQEIYFEPWNYGTEGRRRLLFRLNKRLKRIVGHNGPWFGKAR